MVRVPAGLDGLELNTALAQMGGPEREALDARGATGAEQTLDDQQAPDRLLGRGRQHQPFELGERIRRVDHEAEVAVDLRRQRLAKKPGAKTELRLVVGGQPLKLASIGPPLPSAQVTSALSSTSWVEAVRVSVTTAVTRPSPARRAVTIGTDVP